MMAIDQKVCIEMDYLIITDADGVLTEEGMNYIRDFTEPKVSSVVFTHGVRGVAWQRMGKDGLWYRMGGGRPKTWAELILYRRVVLIHDVGVIDEVEEEARSSNV